MNISDIITVIGLIIAIYAVISQKERKSVMLKFYWFDVVISLFTFLFVSYSVLFDYFVKWHIYIGFTISANGLLAKDWASLITLAWLSYIGYKIVFGFYPASNKIALLEYYKGLADSQEYLFLLTLVEKYHKIDIIEYLKHLDPKEPKDQGREISKPTRIQFAELIFNGVVCREDFVKNTANSKPYFFADILLYHKKLSYESLYFLEYYFNTLIEFKNPFLIQSFKQASQVITDIYEVSEDNKIVFLYMQDLKIIEDNRLWEQFGGNALNEIRNEKLKKLSSVLNQKYHTDEIFWNYRSYVAIIFFDMVLRKAIIQNYQYHMWLFYYNHMVDAILEILEIYPENTIDLTDEFPTNTHRLIYEMVFNMCRWLELMDKTGILGLLESICYCFGACICSIILCDDKKIGAHFKSYILDIAFKTYFDANNPTIKSKLAEMIIKPTYSCQGHLVYVSKVLEVWSSFDKVPYHNQVTAFQNDIIAKL